MEELEVAQVLKPQGIKGELKFSMLARCKEDIESLKELKLDGQIVTIETSRESNGFLYIKFNEFNSISEVERFKNKYLMADKTELAEYLDDGEYFIDDLVNKPVEFENGVSLGVIEDVSNYGSADVITVKKNNGKEVLFSFVDGVIIEVTEEKVILNKSKFDEVSV